MASVRTSGQTEGKKEDEGRSERRIRTMHLVFTKAVCFVADGMAREAFGMDKS